MVDDDRMNGETVGAVSHWNRNLMLTAIIAMLGVAFQASAAESWKVETVVDEITDDKYVYAAIYGTYSSATINCKDGATHLYMYGPVYDVKHVLVPAKIRIDKNKYFATTALYAGYYNTGNKTYNTYSFKVGGYDFTYGMLKQMKGGKIFLMRPDADDGILRVSLNGFAEAWDTVFAWCEEHGDGSVPADMDATR